MNVDRKTMKRAQQARMGLVPNSPPAANRGKVAYIPNLGVGFGNGSPANMSSELANTVRIPRIRST